MTAVAALVNLLANLLLTVACVRGAGLRGVGCRVRMF